MNARLIRDYQRWDIAFVSLCGRALGFTLTHTAREREG